jgi:hypothetical protein
MYFFLKAYSNPKKSSRKLHYEIIMHNSIIICHYFHFITICGFNFRCFL